MIHYNRINKFDIPESNTSYPTYSNYPNIVDNQGLLNNIDWPINGGYGYGACDNGSFDGNNLDIMPEIPEF